MHGCTLICFSHVRLCATLWTAAHQAPPSTGFSRQEHWSGAISFSSFQPQVSWMNADLDPGRHSFMPCHCGWITTGSSGGSFLRPGPAFCGDGAGWGGDPEHAVYSTWWDSTLRSSALPCTSASPNFKTFATGRTRISEKGKLAFTPHRIQGSKQSSA